MTTEQLQQAFATYMRAQNTIRDLQNTINQSEKDLQSNLDSRQEVIEDRYVDNLVNQRDEIEGFKSEVKREERKAHSAATELLNEISKLGDKKIAINYAPGDRYIVWKEGNNLKYEKS